MSCSEGAACVNTHGLDDTLLVRYLDVTREDSTPIAVRLLAEEMIPSSAVPGLEVRQEALFLMNEALLLLALHTPRVLLLGATPPLLLTPTAAQPTAQCGWSGAVRVECARADAFVV